MMRGRFRCSDLRQIEMLPLNKDTSYNPDEATVVRQAMALLGSRTSAKQQLTSRQNDKRGGRP